MPSISVSSVEILSKNTLLVTFSEALSTSDSNYLPGSYSIVDLSIRDVISPTNDSSPLDVILVTDALLEGVDYVLSAIAIVSASGNSFDDTITVKFTGKITKLDKALGSTPTLYDTNPKSTIRQILVAIHRENDKIGGE